MGGLKDLGGGSETVASPPMTPTRVTLKSDSSSVNPLRRQQLGSHSHPSESQLRDQVPIPRRRRFAAVSS